MRSVEDLGLRGGERRLWGLIEERARKGADTKVIDRRIWDLFGERWAVMFTDLAGFSRQVADFGITHFLQIIHEQKELLLPVVDDHDGLVLKAEADSFLILFRKPETALGCAIHMQHACQRANARRAPEEEILLCVGIGYGDMLRVGDHDVWGVEVNAASKLGEDTAKSDEILVTGSMASACDAMENLRFDSIDTVAGVDSCYRVGY